MYPKTVADRFWGKVEKTASCWLWKAGLLPNGYGKFWLHDESAGAHRVAYELTKGRIPPGMDILHTCGEKSCCNPDHLRVRESMAPEKVREQRREAARRWKQKNRERCYAKTKEWRLRNRDSVNAKASARYHRNRETIRAQETVRRLANPQKTLLRKAEERARAFGLELTITERDIQIPQRCPLLGIELRPGVGGSRPHSPTLDRIDPSRGYVPDNVWVISYRANRIKNDASLEELEAIAAGLRKRLSSR